MGCFLCFFFFCKKVLYLTTNTTNGLTKIFILMKTKLMLLALICFGIMFAENNFTEISLAAEGDENDVITPVYYMKDYLIEGCTMYIYEFYDDYGQLDYEAFPEMIDRPGYRFMNTFIGYEMGCSVNEEAVCYPHKCRLYDYGK